MLCSQDELHLVSLSYSYSSTFKSLEQNKMFIVVVYLSILNKRKQLRGFLLFK
jgi:hypothetical protein